MQPTTARGKSLPAGPDSSSARLQTVLVITPDAQLRQALQRVLGLEGYRVLTAAHAGHALLACLKAEKIDVAAIELWMADISGPELAERLRRVYPALPAIFFGQSGTTECENVIVRPFTRDDVLAGLATARAAAHAWEPTSVA